MSQPKLHKGRLLLVGICTLLVVGMATVGFNLGFSLLDWMLGGLIICLCCLIALVILILFVGLRGLYRWVREEDVSS